MGEISRGNVSVQEDDSLCLSKEFTLVEPHLKEAPFAEFCGDVVMGTDTYSIEHTDPICNEPLDLTPISSPLLPTSPSYMLTFHESLFDIRGYNPSFDLYCAYLEDIPREIMWSTFIPHTFNFYTVFDKFKRPLTFVVSSFVVSSHLHHSEMHAIVYDKLL